MAEQTADGTYVSRFGRFRTFIVVIRLVRSSAAIYRDGPMRDFFELKRNGTTVRTELAAGCVTFLTMAYIIVVQPAVLSGSMAHRDTGMDFGAVFTATCLAAALASAIMALVARYPIAQAPGMGENFFFVFTTIPAAATIAGHGAPWQIALGVVFWSGVLFLILTLSGLRERLLDAISPSVKHGIGAGIGLFVAFIGLQNGGLILQDPATAVKLNPHWASPDLLIFFFGLLLTAGLSARRVPGAIFWGIVASALATWALRYAIPHLPEEWRHSPLVADSSLLTRFQSATQWTASPPSLAPLFLQFDLRGALDVKMLPHIGVFLFMVLFDTIGTLIAVGRQAGLLVDGRLVRGRRAMLSDALGTIAGACFGTSTVTSYIESAAGVAQGGRTGLTSLTVAALFLAALFFSPLANMIGSYPPIYAPALVVVGTLMVRSCAEIPWDDPSEAIPAFLTMIGIPLSYSIADGLALGLVGYPIVKCLAGKLRELSWASILLAGAIIAFFIGLR